MSPMRSLLLALLGSCALVTSMASTSVLVLCRREILPVPLVEMALENVISKTGLMLISVALSAGERVVMVGATASSVTASVEETAETFPAESVCFALKL